MSDERRWRIERTRISTDFQDVTSYSVAAAMEIALDAPRDKWHVKHGLADDPNATYTVRPLDVEEYRP